MSNLCLITGILLVLFVVYDLTYTTLAPKGAGVITSRVSSWIWKSSLYITGYNGRKKFLNSIGYLLLLIILTIWVLAIWLGNTLIIYSDTAAVVDSNGVFVTDFLDKAYYIGYVLSTMGSGEYKPVSDGWKIYAAFISFTGLIIITIAISYIVPVINAVAEKRALASYIAGLGENPYDVLRNSYNGKDFKSLEEHFSHIIQEVLKLTKNHQAYPALHYFHEDKFFNSTCIYLSCLDEVLTILIFAVEEEKRPKKTVIMPLRRSMTMFLQTLYGAYLNPSGKTPELPNRSKLNDILKADINEASLKKTFKNFKKRRRIILAYLRHHGWTWEDMYTASFKLDFE